MVFSRILEKSFFYCLVILSPLIATGASFIQVGVNSNFVTRGDLLYFAQSDGSLTALDVQTGKPIRRIQGNFSGTLKDVPEGLLVLGYSGWQLWDWKSFKKIRESSRVYQSQYQNGVIVYGDGNGHFTARRLSTDELLWTFNHPGAVTMRVDGGHALFHCSGRFGYGTPVLVLIDLITGKEIFRKRPGAGIQHMEAFLHDEQVIVLEGEFIPDGQDRANAWLRRQLRFDLTGELMMVNEELPERVSERLGSVPDYFHWDDLWFYHDRTKRVASVPSEDWTPGPLYEGFDWGHIIQDRIFFDGNVSVNSWYLVCHDPDPVGWHMEQGERHLLEVRGEEPTRRLLLPTEKVNQYSRGGALSAVTIQDNTLLIGTSYGRVESIDLRSSKSNWTYLFRTNRPMVSYSRRAGFSIEPPFPYFRDQANSFQELNEPVANPGYFIFLAEDFDLHGPDVGRYLWNRITPPLEFSAGVIHYDPEPLNPFANLWIRQLVAWFALLVIFGGIVTMVLAQAKSRLTWRAAGWIALVLMVALFLSLPFLIFIEPFTSRSLFVAIPFTALYLLTTIVCNYWFRNWITATAGLLVIGYFSWAMIWF